jgi:hypothetical protein
MHPLLASTCSFLDQARSPPPSLREVLGAYNTKGDGDRDMLLAVLSAKTAEDQVSARPSKPCSLLTHPTETRFRRFPTAHRPRPPRPLSLQSFGTPSNQSTGPVTVTVRGPYSSDPSSAFVPQFFPSTEIRTLVALFANAHIHDTLSTQVPAPFPLSRAIGL